MPDSLEELAAKHERAEAAAQRERLSQLQAREEERKSEKHVLLRRSLGTNPRWLLWVMLLVSGAVGVLPYFLDLEFVDDRAPDYIVVLVPVLMITLVFFRAQSALFSRSVRKAMRWLHSLPFQFDIEAYLSGLKEDGHWNRRICLHIVFLNEPTDAERELFASAVQGAVPTSGTEWQERTLSVTSAEMKTKFSGKSEYYYDNGLLHRWLVDIVDSTLERIAARQPIKRVDVEFL